MSNGWEWHLELCVKGNHEYDPDGICYACEMSYDEQITQLKAKIDELTIDLDVTKAALRMEQTAVDLMREDAEL
jgi:hypothetical protein